MTPYLFNFLEKHFPGYINFFPDYPAIVQADKELRSGKSIILHDLELLMDHGKIRAILHDE